VGNGDASLTMYGESITPIAQCAAVGVLETFFDSGEVSGDGHVWSIPRPSARTIWKRPGSIVSRQPENLRLEGVWPTTIRCCKRFPTSTSRPAAICGRSGRAWQELLPLRRICLDDVLQ